MTSQILDTLTVVQNIDKEIIVMPRGTAAFLMLIDRWFLTGPSKKKRAHFFSGILLDEPVLSSAR